MFGGKNNPDFVPRPRVAEALAEEQVFRERCHRRP